MAMAQSFTSHFNYDVFLSFRGEDTRYNFTGNLYDAFHRRGIKTFFDDQELKNGDELSSSLLKAIEESRIFVIVLSENYASSTWCLDELVKILQCTAQNNQRVWPIFYKVNPSDIRHQRNSYGDAMTKHEEMFGNDSERVRKWRSALIRVANFKGNHFSRYEYESKFIDDIVKKVSIKLPPKGLHIGEHVVGLKPHLEEVISLLDISSQSMVCMLGIHGIGGIGKTTLAKALYNSIVHQFEYASFLIDVRETSNQYKGLVSLQETLLSKMLREENIKLSNVDEGAFLIKNRLRNRRVLLVLDDVNCREQLEKLVGECNWFGSGSKIIITTRDKHLLLAHGVEKTYEMKGLDHHEALQLFCWKAFHSSYPPERFVGFSNKIVNYARGHPLTLKVIGSNLFGKDLDACEHALEQYKRIPNEDIQRILRKSYDGLEENQKHIFLDIACFFKGHSLEYVENILHACDFGPKYHIEVLVDKSLITIEYGRIQMHDLIQDMGKEVVRKVAPKEPGRRSRLWLDEEIIKVLEENSGTYKIEGIVLKSPQQKIQWKGAAFKKMKNLRILIVQDACFSVGPKYLPNSLRILVWNQCPSTSLPSNFDLKNLVVFEMPCSSIKLEKSFENCKYLSVMNFSYCQFITEVPNMSGASALKTLNFSHCENLVRVHDSIGFLPKVTILYLQFCEKLTSLPSAMQMASLETLDIMGCKSLEHFPDILGNMDCLSNINATNAAIKELPNSIGNLISLRVLKLSGSKLVSIPESIRKLSNLEVLQIASCRNIQEIYEIPSNVHHIYAVDCPSLNLHSCNVLQSQVNKEILGLDIYMPGAHIPDWFDHCCKGRFLSFWARQKLPHVSFAIIYRFENERFHSDLQFFINGFEVEDYSPWFLGGSHNRQKGCHMLSKDLNQVLGRKRIEGLERYLQLEWNYIEIEVATDAIIDECGIYVYKRGTRMEDVQFECPYPPAELVLRNALKRGAAFHNEPPKKLQRKHEPKDYRGKFQNPCTESQSLYVYKRGSMEDVQFEFPYPPAELVLRNALKRGAAFHNEPPKKLQRKHEPKDYRGKFHNPCTERKTYSLKKHDQILAQNQNNDIHFPWERLWNLHLPPKVIIFLWELVNCVLPTSDLLNSRHVQLPQICFLCGVENENSQHIFMQCTFARALWIGSQLSIRPNNLEPPDVINLIKLCLVMGHINVEIHKELTCPMALILYTIWYFRNKVIFKGDTPSPEAAFKVWLRFCQKYAAACPAIELTNSNFTDSNSAQIHQYLLELCKCKVYLSVHRVKKFTSKITYCQAFILRNSSLSLEGNFLMSGLATKFQVLFQGFRSLLIDTPIGQASTLRIYMPSSSCIAMLNDPSMAPPHLQTIVEDVNHAGLQLRKFKKPIQFSCKSFPHSSSVRVKSGSLGSIGKWRFFSLK